MDSNLIISDNEKFEKIKEEILRGGFENLHFISDFDRTLTNAYIGEGEHVPSLISILRSEGHLVEGYSEKAYALFNRFHPIELDDKTPLDEKQRAMEQWWKEHCELLIESGLNKKDIENVAKSEKIKFRGKTKEILNLLNEKNVPFLILSANGLGDESTISAMKAHNLFFSNVHVISNKYVWDKYGNAIDYIKPLIHTFNKNETSVKNTTPVYNQIKNRKNVMLLGDSLGDIQMIEGFDYDNLLKVGFLNSEIDDKLEEYKKHYDVIITNDSSMDFVYEFLKKLS